MHQERQALRHPPPPIFWSKVKEHLNIHGPGLVAESIILLLVFVPPTIVLLGTKALVTWGANPRPLHLAEVADTILVSLLLVLIPVNFLGQACAVIVSGWQQWKKENSATD
jgi:hypothetical protein